MLFRSEVYSAQQDNDSNNNLYAGPAVNAATMFNKKNKKIALPPVDSPTAYQLNDYLNKLSNDDLASQNDDIYADLQAVAPDPNALSMAQRVSDFRTSLVNSKDLNV